MKTTPVALIERLADQAPRNGHDSTRPAARANGHALQNGVLDIESWLTTRNVAILNRDTAADGVRRWFVTCPGIASHSTTNGSRDCVVTQEPSGKLGGKCFHDSCGMRSWHDISEAIGKPKRGDYPKPLNQKRGGPSDGQKELQLPSVTLPGNSTTITEAASHFGDLLAATGRNFRRGDSVSDLAHDQDGQPVLRIIKPAGFASALESVARLVKIIKTEDGEYEEVPTTCSETTARLILNASEFKKRLPPINVVSPCPVLVERDGQLFTITGYDLESGVLAAGESPPDISLADAKKMLDEMIADFRYTSPADRSRHLASIITPALVLGGLLGGRAPVDLTEANESQAGKGYGNKLTSAVYGMKLRTITQRKSGVGGIEESFSGALVSGAPIISLDNLRGKVDLPALESFMTEDFFQARVPYSGDVEIDARRIVVMLTSNKAEITPDFANRAGIKRIFKQPDGFQFRQYPEGDILDHVRASQSRYLGAVFAIIRAWHAAGKQRTTETRHDFRRWATTLDWIVQELLGCPPLLDGHQETQRRMATPTLTWLRDVALAVARSGKTGEWLRTYQILEVVEAADLEIPGATETTDLEDEVTRTKVLRVIGKKLGGCFRDDKTTIDDVTIQRRQTLDHEFRQRPEYQFLETCKNAETPNTPNNPQQTPEQKCRDPEHPEQLSYLS